MASGFELAEHLDFLTDLGSTGMPYFLEGGQAMNFWTGFYAERAGGVGLKDFAPFTSKDCDIWGGYPLLRYPKGIPSHSPGLPVFGLPRVPSPKGQNPDGRSIIASSSTGKQSVQLMRKEQRKPMALATLGMVALHEAPSFLICSLSP